MYPSLVETILIFKSKKAIVSKFRVYYKIHTIFPSNCQIGPFLSFSRMKLPRGAPRAAKSGRRLRVSVRPTRKRQPPVFGVYALSFAIFTIYCSP
jgi:hypothetical protein